MGLTLYSPLLCEGKRKHPSIPFSDSCLLLISERVLPERQHHELGAVDEHDSAAILRVHAHNGDMHVLHETVLQNNYCVFICASARRQKG